jgi:hypothetical protein
VSHRSITRGYALGLGYGCVWLIAVSMAFGMLDAYEIMTTARETLLSILGVLVIGGALLLLSVRFLRLAYQLPQTGTGRISRTQARLFGALILLELIGWGVLDSLLVAYNHPYWIVPANLWIIALHFPPLAFVFRMPVYAVMGLLWIGAILACLILIPSTTVLGRVSAWTTVPSLCWIIITWMIVPYLLTTAVGSLRLALRRPLEMGA